MSALVVQHLVTLAEATKIMRFFKRGKHSKHGYFFELQDLGAPMYKAVKLPGLEPYGERYQGCPTRQSVWDENAYILRVHRDILAP